jgi:hypothetical protein
MINHQGFFTAYWEGGSSVSLAKLAIGSASANDASENLEAA